MSKKEDPRIIRTKRAFEKALLQLLKENEYEKITVRKIAEIAGLNRATFYLHYVDKEDLLEQYLTKFLKDFEQNAEIMTNEFSYEYNKPHPLFIRMFEHIQNNRKFYKIMLLKNENPQIIFSVRRIINSFVKQASEHMIKEGIKFSVPSNIRESFITSAYLGTIIWWLENDMPYSPKYMATQLTIISTVGPFEENPFLKSKG